MFRSRRAPLALTIALLFLAVRPAYPASFDVPGGIATLQAAVAAASLSPDVENTILISASPIMTGAPIDIGAAFGLGRHLVIQPTTILGRATIANTDPSQPIFNMNTAGNVTLQDLDIVRHITNDGDLVVMNFCEDVVIERCRIGSNWISGGTANHANVRITYPTGIILRNNIMFALLPGTFDHGIWAGSFNDPGNSLRLYNNVVSDAKVQGIRIEAAIPGPLVLLRNNVVVNQKDLVPEPVAYRTDVLNAGPTVVTSHNTAFASAGFVLSGGVGTQDIAGLGMSFLTFTKAQAAGAFVTPAWVAAPPWDDNPDFYRLVDGGPMHDDAGDYGMNVGAIGPDVPVIDDIEHDVRPGGAGPHTDRGVDQIEPGASSGSGIPVEDRGLRAAVVTGPGGGAWLEYAAPRTGRLELRVVDVSGRLVHRDAVDVAAGSRGLLDLGIGPHERQPVFYRVRLVSGGAAVGEVTGKVFPAR